MSRIFRIYVMKKEGIYDPEAETVRETIVRQGYYNISKIRLGKIYELDIEDENINKSTEDIKNKLKKIADEILSNPIIEEYEIEEGNK